MPIFVFSRKCLLSQRQKNFFGDLLTSYSANITRLQTIKIGSKMKKLLFSLVCTLVLAPVVQSAAQNTIRVFDTVLFYDGYAGLVSNPPPAGVTRFRNDLISRKLTDQELQSIGTSLTINVKIKAACDNYDRIGNVNLVLVPKGSATYNPSTAMRIEVGRFITPFMNKNAKRDTVLYNYSSNNLAFILKETSITASYDIWAELQVFGVPYAAQTQITGCTGRTDVFYGTLDLVTNSPAPAQSNNVLIPVSFQHYLNNYDTTKTDTLGLTTKTFNINVPTALTDAALFLITSNHGSNTNGEEYNRRQHYIYFDNAQVLNYIPGDTSCEPYRKVNTQGNGIYGPSPRTNAEWQSFSNWCPGSAIPIRRINLGPVTAGNHKFRISVPDAVFQDGQGYFPVSLYLQGKTSGSLGIQHLNVPEVVLYPNPVNDILTVKSDEVINRVEVYNLMGQNVLRTSGNKIDMSGLREGMYTVHIFFVNNQIVVQKITKN